MIEVGKIENDKACFMNLSITADVFTGEIHIDLEYDKRIIKSKEKLKEMTSEYLEKVEYILSEDLKDTTTEREDNQ